MRNLLIYLLMASFFFSCEKAFDLAEILGSYELTEIAYDTGGGDIEWESVTAGETLEFREDGKVVSTTFLCSNGASVSSQGDYSIETREITCSGTVQWTFEIEGDELTLEYIRCVEPCYYKFSRTE